MRGLRTAMSAARSRIQQSRSSKLKLCSASGPEPRALAACGRGAEAPWQRRQRPSRRSSPAIRASFAIQRARGGGRRRPGRPRARSSRAILEAFLGEAARQPACAHDGGRAATSRLAARTRRERLADLFWTGRRASFARSCSGRCLYAPGAPAGGHRVVEGVLERKPDNSIALRKLWRNSMAEANQHEKAADSLPALARARSHAARYRGSSTPTSCGCSAARTRATAAFRRALELDPNSGAAWWGLANYFPSADHRRRRRGDGAGARRTAPTAPQDGGPLHVALGRLAERAATMPKRSATSRRARRLRRAARIPTTPHESARSRRTDRASLTPERFAASASGGMPRRFADLHHRHAEVRARPCSNGS